MNGPDVRLVRVPPSLLDLWEVLQDGLVEHGLHVEDLPQARKDARDTEIDMIRRLVLCGPAQSERIRGGE